MNNKIIIVSGDPNSINSEIIFKTWKKLSDVEKRKVYLITNYNLINNQFKKLKYNIITLKIRNIQEKINSKNLKIINVPISFNNSFNVTEKECSKFVSRCLNLAHKMADEKLIKGFINCPINKKLLKNSKKIGVTELLASKCKIKDNSELMLIHNKNFSVAPITTHIKIKNVSKKISTNLIFKKIITLNDQFKKLFKKKPKIGILGLNPHNNELSKDSEEIKVIIPAILKLKRKGINITGPLIADTVFINNYKDYDVIVGMYHDQVLIPFKTIYKFDAINITLGLNYVRVSPDHGTAADLIGKNKANPISLFKCIKFIKNLN
tara:strand:+ start:353 stop:1318 length:966 start_codon:yes stop_codon:yes gene_type:complete